MYNYFLESSHDPTESHHSVHQKQLDSLTITAILSSHDQDVLQTPEIALLASIVDRSIRDLKLKKLPFSEDSRAYFLSDSWLPWSANWTCEYLGFDRTFLVALLEQDGLL